MPQTNNYALIINNRQVDTDESVLNTVINWALELPEDFLTKQGAQALDISLPCTKLNDQVFNTFHNAEVEDLSPDTSYRQWMDFIIYCNGVIIFKGYCIIVDVTITDKPEYYNIQAFGGSAQWIIDMQNMTLWDAVSAVPHTFDVSTVENSWKDAISGGFDSDIDHDFVYAPVRYRQPFGPNDDEANIYALRPAISIYWMIQRAFNQLGYTVNSQFLNTPNYFRRFVLPWVWGDFYDIKNQLSDGLSFTATGPSVLWHDFGSGSDYTVPPPGATAMFTFVVWGVWLALEPGSVSSCLAVNPQPNSTLYYIGNPLPLGPAADTYVISYTGAFIPYTAFGCTTLGNTYSNFRINNILPPTGKDDFGLYSFDDATGTMRYDFAPPSPLAGYISSNATLEFVLNLYAFMNSISGKHCDLKLEVIHYNFGGGVISSTTTGIIAASGSGMSGSNGCTGGGGISGTIGRPSTLPWIYNFSVSSVNPTDYITFRLIFSTDSGLSSTSDQTLSIYSSFYQNVNPNVTGASNWQYDSVTQKWGYVDNSADPDWQLFQSSLQMTNLQLELGGSVNFKNYDAFRNYKITDLLGGLVELFNLEVSTDPINKIVSFEPMFGTTLPDTTVIDGWFSTTKILDWTYKRDFNKASKMTLFSNIERQLDFSMKQDGSDGGQNIYSARYKGIYLNNVLKPSLDNNSIRNGIIAGVPGASRYMLPDRFTKGNKQTNNRFFSASMHYNHSKWKGIDPAFPNTPAPQLMCIFPENINDSSASAVTQTFEPKIAFYKGQVEQNTDGAWKWVGDPNSKYTYPTNVSFKLPKMFAVNYSGANCELDPALTYCDQNIGGALVQGLMRRYFLRRFAIMRNGQLFTAVMRLNLNDVCNWNHQEAIKVGNSIYALISIDGYKPFTDQSNECTMWRIVNPEQIDIDNSYPSANSVLNYPLTLTPYDLKYAQLLLFQSDIPQIG